MQTPNDMDDVVERLGKIIERSMRLNDRRGYFAAVYRTVSQRVRAAIRNRQFQDNERMERLAVAFAARYFDAYERREHEEPTTAAWARAFDAAIHDGLSILEHLLLAANAHITLDLGIAVAEIAPGPAFQSLHTDFARMADVLVTAGVSTDDELVKIIGRSRPGIACLAHLVKQFAPGAEATYTRSLMKVWRAMAWRFATSLARVDAHAREQLIAHQDREAVWLADVVILGAPAERFLTGADTGQVADNIRILAPGVCAAAGAPLRE